MKTHSSGKSARQRTAPAGKIGAASLAAPRVTRTHGNTQPCACGGACPRCQNIGSSLSLGGINDHAEHEAARFADHVVRSQPRRSPISADTGRTSASAAPIPSSVYEVINSPGQQLSPSTRADLEPRLERSLSHVEVHTDSRAANSAENLGARAYTVGNHIAFNTGQYTPDTLIGQQLLAHEVAHVAQNEARAVDAALVVRRDPKILPGTHLLTMAEYEWDGTQQKKTNHLKKERYAVVNYDTSTGNFACTFCLLWRFPETWGSDARKNYRDEFEKSVKSAWQGKFPLVRYEGGKPTTDRANVVLAFDSLDGPDMKASGDDNDYINWRSTPAGADASFERWIMKVRNTNTYRDNVDDRIVNLDNSANRDHTNSTSDYTDRTITNDGYPPYQHYFDAGMTPSRGNAAGGNYTQNTSAHEFGHMLGLADEYVLSKEDYQNIVAAKGKPAADAALKKRSGASNRIENIGNQVTKDAYQPFADFLCTATSQDWRIQ